MFAYNCENFDFFQNFTDLNIASSLLGGSKVPWNVARPSKRSLYIRNSTAYLLGTPGVPKHGAIIAY